MCFSCENSTVVCLQQELSNHLEHVYTDFQAKQEEVIEWMSAAELTLERVADNDNSMLLVSIMKVLFFCGLWSEMQFHYPTVICNVMGMN
jgi:hypothetical protein